MSLPIAVSPNSDKLPLWVLLFIMYKAYGPCYINYFKGFKLLTKWAGPLKYSDNSDTSRLPPFLGSYTTQEIALVLDISQVAIYKEIVNELHPRIEALSN